MRILFSTGNDGKFTEAVHAFDHLSGGGVTAGRVTVRGWQQVGLRRSTRARPEALALRAAR